MRSQMLLFFLPIGFGSKLLGGFHLAWQPTRAWREDPVCPFEHSVPLSDPLADAGVGLLWGRSPRTGLF